MEDSSLNIPNRPRSNTSELEDTVAKLATSNLKHVKHIKTLNTQISELEAKNAQLKYYCATSKLKTELYYQVESALTTDMYNISQALSTDECVSIIHNTLKSLFELDGLVIHYSKFYGHFEDSMDFATYCVSEYGSSSYPTSRNVLNQAYHHFTYNVTRCNKSQCTSLGILDKTFVYTAVIVINSVPVYGMLLERSTELSPIEIEQLDRVIKMYAITLHMRRQLYENSIIMKTFAVKFNQLNKSYQQAVATSFTDELTKINNKTALTNRVSSFSKTTPYVIVFFDIDNFKFINDTYGHSAGDQVLQWFANRIKHASEELGGEVFRYGGDEFIAVFQGDGDLLNLVQSAMQSLIQTIRSKVFQFTTKVNTDIETPVLEDGLEETYPHSITTSIGIFNKSNDMTFEEAKAYADDAMYKSKQNGKNSITVIS